MMRTIQNRLFFVPALLLSLPLALAQAPSGEISFTFDRTTVPVWDFTGAYQFDQQMVGLGSVSPLSFQVFITHDLAGRLRGLGTTIVTIGQDVVSANYVVIGSVSLGGNATRAIFKISLVGDGLDLIAGQPRGFRVSLLYDLVVDPNPANTPAWIPRAGNPGVRGTVSVSGVGAATVIPGNGFAVALPPGVNGKWSLDMDILALNRLGGSATIVIDSAAPPDRPLTQPGTRTLNANLVGTFNARLASSQVVLAGIFDTRPASLQLSFFNGATAPSRMSGRLLGQTIRQ